MATAIIASGIYQIKNIVNGKIYIGSSVNIRTRWRAHLSSLRKNTHHSAALQRAWNKYGESCFEFSIIEIVQDLARLFEIETHHISLAKSHNGKDGYNTVQIGGSCLGFKHTDESKKRMSASQKLIPIEYRLTYCKSFTGRNHTDETKALMSKNSKRLSPSEEQRLKISRVHKGKTISESHKEIVRAATTLRNKTPEMREKVSAALKGRIFSDEWRAKISASNIGKVISDEQRLKISLSLKGRAFSPEHLAKIKATKDAKKAQKLNAVNLAP